MVHIPPWLPSLLLTFLPSLPPSLPPSFLPSFLPLSMPGIYVLPYWIMRPRAAQRQELGHLNHQHGAAVMHPWAPTL